MESPQPKLGGALRVVQGSRWERRGGASVCRVLYVGSLHLALTRLSVGN